jgi:hypothetical protein
MTRVSLDLDPRILTRLRAIANRRGVTVDVVAGELLGAAIRSPAARSGPPTTRVRAGFGPIDVSYDDGPTSEPTGDGL